VKTVVWGGGVVAPTIAEGTFRHANRSGGGLIFGETVDVSYGGITTITSYPGAGSFSPNVIMFPAGLVVAGDLTYEMTLSPTTSPTTGVMWVQAVEILTNINVADGPDHFLSGTTPGVTVFSGSVVFGTYPYTFAVDTRINLVVSALGGSRGVVDSHWEVEVV
jgi:hypothetical protein